ncbi:hypothetical protein BBJ28_00024197 [Nothophytophthora sp. Chile5]|nr:hypothetical protein BBJ28_00024197 [Nothophytophthora sp. Chile5]
MAMLRPKLWLLCLCAGVGTYLCSSGLLRLNEVFFQGTAGAAHSLGGSEAPLDDGQLEASAAYDRLVIVLIDALRADMVLGSTVMHGHDGVEAQQQQQTKGELNAHMPFASGLVTSGQALGYVAHASVPTVTMPRLKALVTGKAPAFIDILKNFNSVALGDDANLVALLAANEKRIVFYGDDTWLKLFPTAFQRSDGTSGFYTRDTVEVDDNVTRHLQEELDPIMQHAKSGDWDVLVLHYLGLDHVGHLRGPRSPMMQDKLQEMDQVVQLIVESVRDQDARRKESDSLSKPSLILLCSDHGMSEVGNHGGATLEESSALMMFLRGDGKLMKPQPGSTYRQKRNQVDLVPTISSLFGLAIPPYSTGLLLDDVVRASSDSALQHRKFYLHALLRNFQQLYTLAMIKFHASALEEFNDQFKEPLRQLRTSLQGEDDAPIDEKMAAAVLKACEILQTQVSQSDGSEYNAPMICIGLVLLFFSGFAALRMLVFQSTRPEALPTEATEAATEAQFVLRVLGMGSVLQIASLSSSSSIENEHATAFFLMTTLLVAFGLHLLRQRNALSSASSPIRGLAILAVLLVATRALRTRNQVINFGRLNGMHVDANLLGNEFATDDSVSILSTNPVFPSHVLPPIASVTLISGLVLWKTIRRTRTTATALGIAVGSGLLFIGGMLAILRVKKLSGLPSDQGDRANALTAWISLDADGSARVVYAIVILLVALMSVVGQSLRLSLVEMAVWLLVALLQRDSHFPTLCLLCIELEAVSLLLQHEQGTPFRQNGIILAGLTMWLAQTAFFALGNSHLVTTIDISQSYHGLSAYSQGLVGLLTFMLYEVAHLVVSLTLSVVVTLSE